MKYSYNWIQKHIEEKLPAPNELIEKIIFHAFEVEDVEDKNGDTVMEIKVLPDRAGDALSHYGMAREIAGILGFNLKTKLQNITEKYPSSAFEIQTDKCTRYSLMFIKDVEVKDSSKEIISLLESIGQKTINSVVDATNYVLSDIGQPTHVFDADKVIGNIVIRNAVDGEKITTLSGEEKILKENDIVIADDVGLLAIAGVKGGNRAEVDQGTKNILIEVANFDAVSIRKTSRSQGLVTDASKRFENNISNNLVPKAMYLLSEMIKENAGGEIVGYSDHCLVVEEEKEIGFKMSDINKRLGDIITENDVIDVFNKYKYTYQKEGDNFILIPPYYRKDLNGAHDIAEEIGRVVGYEKILPKELPFKFISNTTSFDKKIRSIKNFLMNDGYTEVLTYVFRKKGDISVAHGPKDKSALRKDLKTGLAESFELNRLNAPVLGLSEVKIFEIGNVFNLDGDKITEETRVGLATKGGVEEYLIDEFVEKFSVPDSELEVSTDNKLFKSWSSYPFVVRDIAVWISETENSLEQELQNIIFKLKVDQDVLSVEKFDQFTKDGKTSFAYRIVFQSKDSTLTDAEVSDKLKPILEEIQENPQFELR